MPLTLHNLKPKKGSRKTKKRVGRGLGSTGRYSGRGIKGQRARSGGKSGLQLKGLRGIMLSTPKKKGFTSNRVKPAVLNLSDLNKVFKDGSKVTPKILQTRKLVDKISDGVKILGNGSIEAKITLTGCAVSATAKTKIEAAGGKVIIDKK